MQGFLSFSYSSKSQLDAPRSTICVDSVQKSFLSSKTFIHMIDQRTRRETKNLWCFSACIERMHPSDCHAMTPSHLWLHKHWNIMWVSTGDQMLVSSSYLWMKSGTLDLQGFVWCSCSYDQVRGRLNRLERGTYLTHSGKLVVEALNLIILEG